MIQTFILELEGAEDTRFLADDQQLAHALKRATESVAWAFSRGTQPEVRVLPVPPGTLVTVGPHDG